MLIALAGAGPATPSADPAVTGALERAAAGDADAQNELAVRYRDGRGVRRDHAEALRWARRAADQNHAAALDNVGFHYLRGLGVPASADIAAGYFKAAAARGSDWGAFNLGQCHFGGQGVDQSYTAAAECWTRAARQGHAPAALHLAMMYAAGEGVARDPAEAERLCRRASDAGSADALVLLGELRFARGDAAGARAAWDDAARRGSREAADLLKLMPWRGRKGEPGRFAFVESPHVQQGHNNCGATSLAMLARSQGRAVTQYDVKRRCPAGPIGTGTDWAELVAAADALGVGMELLTFPVDDEGFRRGTQMLRTELDAGRPVVIDFTVPAPDLPRGEAGHTLLVAGYVAEHDLYVLRDPARFSPGVRLMPAAEMERSWRSASYSGRAAGLSRPAIVLTAK